MAYSCVSIDSNRYSFSDINTNTDKFDNVIWNVIKSVVVYRPGLPALPSPNDQQMESEIIITIITTYRGIYVVIIVKSRPNADTDRADPDYSAWKSNNERI